MGSQESTLSKRDIYAAAAAGDVETIRKLLEESKDLDQLDSDGLSALHHACYSGKTSSIHLLVQAGADVNKYDLNGNSPLHLACQAGHEDAIKTLVSNYGANMKQTAQNGWSPLIILAMNGHEELVRYVVNQLQESPNDSDEFGASPLHWATRKNMFEIVKILVNECNADVTIQDVDGNMPLHIAAKSGNLEMAIFFIDANPNGMHNPNSVGDTPLTAACIAGHLAIVQKIASMPNCDLNTQDATGFSALHFAVERGHLDVVQFLCTKKADSEINIEINDNRGRTPLFYAKKLDVMSTLLKDGKAKYSVVDNDGMTPLHIACEYGNLECVKALWDLGPQKTLPRKSTYLHLACLSGNLQTVEFLLNQKEDVFSCDSVERTPLDLACQSGKADVVEFLISHIKKEYFNEDPTSFVSQEQFTSANVPTISIIPAIESMEIGIIRLISENFFVDIHEQNEKHQQPIHTAAKQGKVEILKYVIDLEANPNAVDDQGRTPLHYASADGHKDVVKFLVEDAKATVTGDVDGATPLHYALHQMHIDVLQWFVCLQGKLLTQAKEEVPEFSSYYRSKLFSDRVLESVSAPDFTQLKLLKVECLRELSNFPNFTEAKNEGWLVDGSTVAKHSKILFVSHRYYNPDKPDEKNEHFNNVKNYLFEHSAPSVHQREGFDFLWIDYCCVCPNQLLLDQLILFPSKTQILSALVICTHALILPRIDQTTAKNLQFTNLKDFSNRAWFQFEVMVMILTGCKTQCFFQFGKGFRSVDVEWQKHGGRALEYASDVAVSELSIDTHNDAHIVDDWLLSGADMDFLKVLQRAATGLLAMLSEDDSGSLLQKIMETDLKEEDLSLNDCLCSLYHDLGVVSKSEDKAHVFGMLLFMIIFYLEGEDQPFQRKSLFKRSSVGNSFDMTATHTRDSSNIEVNSVTTVDGLEMVIGGDSEEEADPLKPEGTPKHEDSSEILECKFLNEEEERVQQTANESSAKTEQNDAEVDVLGVKNEEKDAELNESDAKKEGTDAELIAPPMKHDENEDETKVPEISASAGDEKNDKTPGVLEDAQSTNEEKGGAVDVLVVEKSDDKKEQPFVEQKDGEENKVIPPPAPQPDQSEAQQQGPPVAKCKGCCVTM